jgi:hypothetical protein
MSDLSASLTLDPDGGNILSVEVARDARHTVTAAVDAKNEDIYLEFSSREALYDFARSLLHEAVFGRGGQKEFYPLIAQGTELVVDGARFTQGSSRLFVTYPSTLDANRGT